jgi:hypothetical protein
MVTAQEVARALTPPSGWSSKSGLKLDFSGESGSTTWVEYRGKFLARARAAGTTYAFSSKLKEWYDELEPEGSAHLAIDADDEDVAAAELVDKALDVIRQVDAIAMAELMMTVTKTPYYIVE